MTTATLRLGPANTALAASATFWFVIAFLGQWVFLYYILAFYGPSTLSGDFVAWAKNTRLLKGYVAGDLIGNLTFGAHALLAGIISFGGALQLVPQIRRLAPRFHRWNGRVFLVTAIGLSLSGFYLVWVRETVTDLSGAIAVSINGLLILGFAGFAWRTARQRDFIAHRRWALRTYLVANAQWFTRLGVMVWVILNQGNQGLGAFFAFWEFGCYLVPLGVLELYFLSKDKAGPRGRYAMAGGLTALTLVMGIGIVGAYLFFWQPVLAKL